MREVDNYLNMEVSFMRPIKSAAAKLLLLCFAASHLILSGAYAQSMDVQLKQETSIPNTPAGQQLSAFLNAINSGDINTIRNFITERFDESAPGRRAGGNLGQGLYYIYHDTGGLTVYSIEKSTALEIIVIAREKLTGDWWRVRVEVAAEQPHSITSWGIRVAARPTEANPHLKMSESEIARQLDDYLRKKVSADLFSGAVLVAKNGKPIFEKCYGKADKTRNAPVKLDTEFNLASLGKMFTGVAIAQLAEQGKLSFTDTIEKHLPDYPNKDVAGRVTIHQLLTHTSGMGDYMRKEYLTSTQPIRNVRDLFPFFVDKPLSFEPGTKYDYSNAGFIVLGAIIERVSGQSYYDYVNEHIFKPAGMKHTHYYYFDSYPPTVAIPYTAFDDKGQRMAGERKDARLSRFAKGRGGPAGSAYSTVGDMLKFAVALRRHKLLSPEYTDIVMTGKVETDERGLTGPIKYGYGFFDELYQGKRIVGHGGDFPGVNTRFQIYVGLDYTAVILSNYDHPAAQRVAAKLQEMITQE